ncbi:TPA: HNH endonuclease [Candidatus Nomurabacteria bacterium]|nr:HNH endonuclease [Candidatus Nomurabacteria bacterium]
MNNWNIPEELEKEVRERDKVCVYCGVEFGISKNNRKTLASWEHIINDAKIITRDNIARCCAACNASKGIKKLSDWVNSKYCKEKGRNKNRVAPVVRDALNSGL